MFEFNLLLQPGLFSLSPDIKLLRRGLYFVSQLYLCLRTFRVHVPLDFFFGLNMHYDFSLGHLYLTMVASLITLMMLVIICNSNGNNSDNDNVDGGW